MTNKPIEPIEEGREQESYSSLSLYQFCPYAYRLCYIDKVERSFGYGMYLGSYVHSVLDRMISNLVENGFIGEISKYLVLSYCREVKERFEKLTLKSYNDARQWILAYIAKELPTLDYRNILGTEKTIATEIRGQKITGKIDRIDRLPNGAIRIVDYKTGKAYKDELPKQSYIYFKAIAEEYKINPNDIVFEFHYIKAKPKIVPISYAIASSEYAHFEASINNIKYDYKAHSRQHSSFQPKPGWHCKMCHYKDNCDYGKI